MIPEAQRPPGRSLRVYSGNSRITKTYKRQRLMASIRDDLPIETLKGCESSVTSPSRLEPTSSVTPSSSPLRNDPKQEEKKAFAVAISRRRPLRTATRRVQDTRAPPTSLTQLTLDLGQTVRSTCGGCGMSFCPSISLDATLHTVFHAKHVGGIEFPGTVPKPLWEDSGTHHSFIVVVDARSSPGEKRKAYEALSVVEMELGAVKLAEESLWGRKDGGGDRYKVFLYVQQQQGRSGARTRQSYKVVGVVLGERISFAYAIAKAEDASSEMELTGQKKDALMGIARIWTCADARRKGIARRLIEEARKGFIYGMTVEKNQVAFSQPTASGSRLASAVLGDENGVGWLIYKEEL